MPQSTSARRRRRLPPVARTCVSLTLASALGTAVALPSPAAAAPTKSPGKVGVGGTLGDPLGGSLKFFPHPNHGLQLDLGWAPMHHGDGSLTFTYAYHFKPFIQNKIVAWGMYLGAGIGLAFWAGRTFRRFCDDRRFDPDCDFYFYRRHLRRDIGRGGAAMMIRVPVLGFYLHWAKIPLDTGIEGAWSPYVVLWDPYHGDFSVKARYYF